jgi:hypothetical protein
MWPVASARAASFAQRLRRPDRHCNTVAQMKFAAEMILLVLVLAPLVLVGVLFVWGARKDGEEDRALQERLGTPRLTRLGR